jgi:hypothetical protein
VSTWYHGGGGGVSGGDGKGARHMRAGQALTRSRVARGAQVPRRGEVTLSVDHRHMPCGGNDSWSRAHLAEYLIPAGTHAWTVRLLPAAGAAARRRPPPPPRGALAGEPAAWAPPGALARAGDAARRAPPPPRPLPSQSTPWRLPLTRGVPRPGGGCRLPRRAPRRGGIVRTVRVPFRGRGACPVSTGGGTRRVQLVREGGGWEEIENV